MYTRVLLARLRPYVDSKLPDCMFGFRPKRGITACQFVTMTMMQAAENGHLRSGFYAAAMDLNKAYDGVNRELLWQQLHDIGCSRHFVRILQDIYSDTSYALMLRQHVCTPFQATMGLKQGCPLSPHLFNVFVQKLPGMVREACPSDGVTLFPLGSMYTNADTRIQMIMYADYILLVAYTHAGMQRLMNALQAACSQLHLSLSPTKCEAWYVRHSGEAHVGSHPPFVCDGHNLVVSTEPVRYLGLFFGERFDAASMMQRCIRKAEQRRTMLLGFVQQHALVAQSYLITRALYHTLLLPVLVFGCEIWGPAALLYPASGTPSGGSHRQYVQSDLQKAANTFLRRAHALPDSTPVWPLLCYVDVSPVHGFVLRRACSFWNELQCMGSEMVLDAMWSQQHMYYCYNEVERAPDSVQRLWITHLHRSLLPSMWVADKDAHGARVVTQLGPERASALVRPAYMLTKLIQPLHVPAPSVTYEHVVEGFRHMNSRDPQCPHRKHARFFAWFAHTLQCEPFTILQKEGFANGRPAGARMRTDMASFVLGSALFAANRHDRDHPLPYREHVCTICDCIIPAV
jgi:hypothetical protein